MALVKQPIKIESIVETTPQKPQEAVKEAPKPFVKKAVPNIIAPIAKPPEIQGPTQGSIQTIPVAPAKPQEPKKPSIIQAPMTPIEPQIFSKPIPNDPYREPIDTSKPITATKPRVVSWEDILKNKSKEPETHPDAKIALEKAMSDVVLPAIEKPKTPEQNIITPPTNIPKYTGDKDPYREPLE